VTRALASVPLVDGSQSRLGQVFLNLLVNAFQALARTAAARAEVRVASGVSDDGAVFVEVEDNGEGMTPEVRARLFTPPPRPPVAPASGSRSATPSSARRAGASRCAAHPVRGRPSA
jgi:light-regulated signal transduction histidine kinase (bacteriophytochrome)